MKSKFFLAVSYNFDCTTSDGKSFSGHGSIEADAWKVIKNKSDYLNLVKEVKDSFIKKINKEKNFSLTEDQVGIVITNILFLKNK